MKKMLTVLIILAVFGGAVFFAGWVQFSVPAGKYGVLISKTGGVNPVPVVPAQFRWQWERLIPTNTKLVVFDLSPLTRTIHAEGMLPSGDIYSKMLEGSPDFTWKIGLNVTARVTPQMLPVLVRELNIKDQAALDKWAETTIGDLADTTGRILVATLVRDPVQFKKLSGDPASLANAIKEQMAAESTKEIEILAVTTGEIRIPDFALYTLASQTYTVYQEKRRNLLSQVAVKEAGDSVAEYLQIERFSRWGEVLTKYPILIDFLAVARDDAGQTFKAVKGLH